MVSTSMLGHYENFPATIHSSSGYATSISNKKTQETLIHVLLSANKESFKIEDVAYPTIPHCTVIFEFGIADGDDFNYLNEEEANKAIKVVRKTPFETMDFLCDVRYYKKTEERKTALRFDYYMLRFTFGINQMLIQVSHEKGPRHLTPDDLIHFLIERINRASPKKILRELE